MIASDSFVFQGNVNIVFPSLLMQWLVEGFRRQSTFYPSVKECEVVGRGNPPIFLFTPRLTLKFVVKTDWTYAVLGCTMHVVFSYARAEHNIVTTWIFANFQSKINRNSAQLLEYWWYARTMSQRNLSHS